MARGRLWSPEDDEIVMDASLSRRQKAARLGRSQCAVKHRVVALNRIRALSSGRSVRCNGRCHQTLDGAAFNPGQSLCRKCQTPSMRRWQEAANAKSLDRAFRHGEPWTEQELRHAEADAPVQQIAAVIGRSFYAVNSARARLGAEYLERSMA